MSNVYILGGARTPSGSFLSSLSAVRAPELGAIAIKGALAKSGIKAEEIDEVMMGNVVQAGLGQNPARQASLAANVPNSVPCSTINKVCGSGLKAIISGVQAIKSGDVKTFVAGGMENMSQIPFLLPNARNGFKFGSTELKDAMQFDGLWDIYSDRAMGLCAEEAVQKYNITREEQDAYAIRSFQRAQKAQQDGAFKSEIVPVKIKDRKNGEISIEEDEGPSKVRFDKIPTLRPAFDKNGTITAANASTINDGAAAIVLGGEEYKNQAKFRIVAHAAHSHEPTFFTTAPVGAMKKCLQKANMDASNIDFFEINEAFAMVPIIAQKELELPDEKVNIYGSGVSLGHPIGCSGTRIIVTLMNVLERENKKYGMAAICIGGGEALAMIIERL